jgi:hypothetical protein
MPLRVRLVWPSAGEPLATSLVPWCSTHQTRTLRGPSGGQPPRLVTRHTRPFWFAGVVPAAQIDGGTHGGVAETLPDLGIGGGLVEHCGLAEDEGVSGR